MTETEEERDDEPLEEDAEIEPPADGDADRSDEVLTPLPGLDYNPIYGRGGVGAFEGTPAKDVLSGKLSGELLLEVKGKRRTVTTLLFSVIAGAVLMIAAVAFPPGTTWLYLSLVALGVSVVLGAWSLADLIFATDVVVTFTTAGVARHGKGADAWVPWAEVDAYRAEDASFVTLLCAGGAAPVPTPDVDTHAKVIALLDERKVPRA
jgi:hypothetical protein